MGTAAYEMRSPLRHLAALYAQMVLACIPWGWSTINLVLNTPQLDPSVLAGFQIRALMFWLLVPALLCAFAWRTSGNVKIAWLDRILLFIALAIMNYGAMGPLTSAVANGLGGWTVNSIVIASLAFWLIQSVFLTAILSALTRGASDSSSTPGRLSTLFFAGLVVLTVPGLLGMLFSLKGLEVAAAGALTWLVLVFLPSSIVLAWIFVYLPVHARRRRRLAQSQSDLVVPPSEAEPVNPADYVALMDRKAKYSENYQYFAMLLLPALIGLAIYSPRALAATGSMLLCLLMFTGFMFRRRALRILLLRPFGEKKMTQMLRRFVWRNIGPVGYVYTLSDKNYQPSVLMEFLVELPLDGLAFVAAIAVAPLIRNSMRFATVKDGKTFKSLQFALMQQVRVSFRSFLCAGQAFNIRSTDDWWQRCIQSLMHSSDLIVVDLSKVKEGTAWELQELRRRGLLERCMFVVADAMKVELPAILAQHFASGDMPTVFAYDDEGIVISSDISRWNADLAQRIETALLRPAPALQVVPQ